MRRIGVLCVVLTVFLLALPTASQPPPTEVVKFKFVNGELKLVPPLGEDKHGHQRVGVEVRKGYVKNQLEWKGTDIISFKVWITPLTDGAPGSPFESQATSWQTHDGSSIKSGLGTIGADGHAYKFHIKALGQMLDPHICFGRACR